MKLVDGVIVSYIRLWLDGQGNVTWFCISKENTEMTNKMPRLDEKDIYNIVIPAVESIYKDDIVLSAEVSVDDESLFEHRYTVDEIETICNYDIIDTVNTYMSITNQYALRFAVEYDVVYKDGKIGRVPIDIYYIYADAD